MCVRETCRGIFAAETLDYIQAWLADSESSQAETLDFHVEVGCRWLGSLCELADYLTCFPWKAVQSVHMRRWERLLADMKSEWDFVLQCDVFDKKSPVFKAVAVSRLPCFRELFVLAEKLGLQYFFQDSYFFLIC